MSTHLVRFADAVAYRPPGHEWVDARRLQGLEAGGPATCAVGLSAYPPGERATPAPTPHDTVYLVLAGRLVVTTDEGDVTLGERDSLFLPKGTLRSVHNDSDDDAELLVFTTFAG